MFAVSTLAAFLLACAAIVVWPGARWRARVTGAVLVGLGIRLAFAGQR